MDDDENLFTFEENNSLLLKSIPYIYYGTIIFSLFFLLKNISENIN